MRKLRLSLIISMALIVGAGCGDRSDTTVKMEKRRVPVQVERVETSTFVSSLDLIGRIESERAVKLNFEVTGEIESIFFDEGDFVREGDVIARIDQVQYRARFDLARATLRKARIDLESSKALMERNTISRDVFEKAEVAFEQANSNFLLTREALENTEIEAPFDGYIVSRSVEEHEINTPQGGIQPAFIFADMNRLKIEVSISESDIGKVEKGQRAYLRVASFPESRFEGVVDRVALMAAERSNTFKAQVLLINEDSLLKLGMVADVEVVLSENENVIIVDIDALLQDEEINYLFIVEDETARRVNVILMDIQGGRAWIDGRIKAGDLLVTLGARDLADGDMVLMSSDNQD